MFKAPTTKAVNAMVAVPSLCMVMQLIDLMCEYKTILLMIHNIKQ